MRRHKKILILSLTRMGDIVQSIPFVRRLRLRNPDAEIHVLVEQCFADVAGFLPDVAAMRTVRLEDLLPALESGPRQNLQAAAAFYREFVTELRAEAYDEAWNLTHTRPAMVLNYLLTAEQGRGVTLDRSGFQLVNDPWLIYFFATNLARPWCQFNLVDIYANCVSDVPWHGGREMRIDPAAYAGDEFPRRSAVIQIAIHPGASQPAKQWPLRQFRQLAERLVQRSDLELLLIGGPRDKALAAEFHGVPRLTNWIGKTTPRQLAQLLANCQMLISNDSGPMHVAAGVGTPVIAITVGSALGSETAPYGDGHCVIEPDSACFPCPADRPCAAPSCGSLITSEAVYAVAAEMFRWSGNPSAAVLSGSRVYRTRISPVDGLLELQRLHSASEMPRDLLNAAARQAWLNVLEPGLPVERKTPRLDEVLRKPWLNACRSAAMLAGLAAQLERAAAHPERRIVTIEHLAELLRFEEAKLERLMRGDALLNSFWVYAEISRASLHGNDLAAQAAATAAIYRSLQRLLKAMLGNLRPTSDIQSESSIVEEHHENLA